MKGFITIKINKFTHFGFIFKKASDIKVDEKKVIF